jgi:prevent-host-death family protein
MTLIMPATEFRDHLSAILDEVAAGQETVFITWRGQTQVVLLSTLAYEALTTPRRQEPEADFYTISQASLAQIWEHPDEDVYTWTDGEPL